MIFEGLIWLLYVGLYKYNAFMTEAARLHQPEGHPNFPYPQLMLFAVVATLYVVPYYRWLVPALLRRRRYVLLGVVSVLYLWWGIKLNTALAHGAFSFIASPPVLKSYYQQGWEQVGYSVMRLCSPI